MRKQKNLFLTAAETGLELRKMYEGGKIVTEQDFKEAMKHVLSGC